MKAEHPTKLAINQVRAAFDGQFERIDACRAKLSEHDRARAIVQTNMGGGCRVALDGVVLDEWQDEVLRCEELTISNATQKLIDALLNAQRAWEQACYALLSEDERSQAYMRTYQDGSCDLVIDDRVLARWRWEAHCETQPVSPENLLLAK